MLTKLPADLLLWNDDLTRRNVLRVGDGVIQDADGTDDLQNRITTRTLITARH